MKLKLYLLIITLFLLNVLFVYAIPSSLESNGEATCFGSFDGGIFEGSDDTITQMWVWKGSDTYYPWIEKSNVKAANIFGKVTTEQETLGTGTVGVTAMVL